MASTADRAVGRWNVLTQGRKGQGWNVLAQQSTQQTHNIAAQGSDLVSMNVRTWAFGVAFHIVLVKPTQDRLQLVSTGPFN